MDRAAWLAERRMAVEADYSSDAATYDDGYDPATPVHRGFVARLIETCPPGGSVLDAACGTGPYIGMVREAGRAVVGVDQSTGMLARARSKYPDVRFAHVGLQEIAFDGEFDAAMCTDAMEHVPPEDWPLVLGNLRRAVRPGGHVYLTVEEVERERRDEAFAEAVADGSPAVDGEAAVLSTGGYHYYPLREQVLGWLAETGLEIVDQADEWLDGYGYHHLFLRTPGL